MTKCKCSGMLEVERSGSKSRAICVRHADILISFFLRQVAESVSKIQWLQDLQFWNQTFSMIRRGMVKHRCVCDSMANGDAAGDLVIEMTHSVDLLIGSLSQQSQVISRRI